MLRKAEEAQRNMAKKETVTKGGGGVVATGDVTLAGVPQCADVKSVEECTTEAIQTGVCLSVCLYVALYGAYM